MPSLLALRFRSYKKRVFVPFLFFSLQHIFIHSRKVVNRGFFWQQQQQKINRAFSRKYSDIELQGKNGLKVWKSRKRTEDGE